MQCKRRCSPCACEGAYATWCSQLPCFLSMRHGTIGTCNDATQAGDGTTPMLMWHDGKNKPNSPLLVDAREGRLFVLLACCLVCGMQRRRMGIVRRERDMIRYMGAPCTMPVVARLSPVAKAKAGLARARGPLSVGVAYPEPAGLAERARPAYAYDTAPCPAQWRPAWSHIGRPRFVPV